MNQEEYWAWHAAWAPTDTAARQANALAETRLAAAQVALAAALRHQADAGRTDFDLAFTLMCSREASGRDADPILALQQVQQLRNLMTIFVSNTTGLTVPGVTSWELPRLTIAAGRSLDLAPTLPPSARPGGVFSLAAGTLPAGATLTPSGLLAIDIASEGSETPGLAFQYDDEVPPAPPPSVWTKIADEYQGFEVTNGPKIVRFGAGTSWIEYLVSGPGQCSADFFGGDPASGVVKVCEVSS